MNEKAKQNKNRCTEHLENFYNDFYNGGNSQTKKV